MAVTDFLLGLLCNWLLSCYEYNHGGQCARKVFLGQYSLRVNTFLCSWFLILTMLGCLAFCKLWPFLTCRGIFSSSRIIENFPPEKINIQDYCKDKSVVIVGLPVSDDLLSRHYWMQSTFSPLPYRHTPFDCSQHIRSIFS